MSKYSIGLDFGTNSCRALIVDLKNGEEVSSSVYNYPSGIDGIITDPKNPKLARQNPDDYLQAIEKTIIEVIKIAKNKFDKFNPNNIIGIGIDATSSSPMPVDIKSLPLCFNEKFKDNPEAMVWLWKDHTSLQEVEKITNLAKNYYPEYLENIGGSYSSEWFWSKLLNIANSSPEVFNAASSFVEVCDWIPAVLTGKTQSSQIKRSACAAGHKAMFNKNWNGLPSKEFLNKLSSNLGDFRDKLYSEVYPAGKVFGTLSDKWAEILGLSKQTVVSVGTVDAHAGAVGSGVGEGRLVKILGTSTCDVLIHRDLPNIPGVSGIVEDSVIEGYFGIEAGQPAVGDIFAWFVKNLVPDSYGSTQEEKFINLETEAAKLKPGETGLLALDWNNGNRNILSDSRLSGLLLGQTLHTKAHEIYRALIEATAFGSLVIINKLEEYNLPIDDITACGGLAVKNKLLMQIYSDVTGRNIKLAKSEHASAIGAAIFGAVAAGKSSGGFDSAEDAQKVLTGSTFEYNPNSQNHEVYKKLFSLYKTLHDSFGIKEHKNNIYNVMKELLKIKEEVL